MKDVGKGNISRNSICLQLRWDIIHHDKCPFNLAGAVRKHLQSLHSILSNTNISINHVYLVWFKERMSKHFLKYKTHFRGPRDFLRIFQNYSKMTIKLLFISHLTQGDIDSFVSHRKNLRPTRKYPSSLLGRPRQKSIFELSSWESIQRRAN